MFSNVFNVYQDVLLYLLMNVFVQCVALGEDIRQSTQCSRQSDTVLEDLPKATKEEMNQLLKDSTEST